MEKPLSDSDTLKLRQAGKLKFDEIALLVGDVVIAENVINKARRVIETKGLILETKKTLLRG